MKNLVFRVIWKYNHSSVYSSWSTSNRDEYDLFIGEMQLKSNLSVAGICEYDISR
jgi:hypothetical protein